MMFRPFHVVVGALALIASACSDTDNNLIQQVRSTASVRLVNDTDTPLSLTNAGIVDTLDARLIFGQASACVLVNLANTAAPPLTITNGGTGATITFTPGISAGDNLLIVAFGDAAGNVQFTTLNNHFLTTLNSAGLRLFNGVASTGPLLMRRNGAPLTPFVGLGTASGFVSVPIDSGAMTFANASSIVLDAGLMAFPMGQNSTVLIGPPAPETIPLRFFTVQGC